VVLEQLLLGILVVRLVVLLPFLLVMAGVGAAMLLWFVASPAGVGSAGFLAGVSRGLRFDRSGAGVADRVDPCR
jgi:hypothetical protein